MKTGYGDIITRREGGDYSVVQDIKKATGEVATDPVHVQKAKEILAILSGMKYSEVCEALESARLIAGEQSILN